MPGKIKSNKQFKLMEMKAHGGGSKDYGPSPDVAKKMLSEEGHAKRVKLARMK